MDKLICQERLSDALSKACAARTESLRTAYSDLADFYERKLVDRACFGRSDNMRFVGVI